VEPILLTLKFDDDKPRVNIRGLQLCQLSVGSCLAGMTPIAEERLQAVRITWLEQPPWVGSIVRLPTQVESPVRSEVSGLKELPFALSARPHKADVDCVAGGAVKHFAKRLGAVARCLQEVLAVGS
jgi:hypothetical protein